MARKLPRRHGSRAIAAGIAMFAPSPERKQHDHIEIVKKTILDDAGLISAPYRVQSRLERMVEVGDITKPMRDAGERFHADYRLAALNALQAADLMRAVRHQASDTGIAILEARKRRDKALASLGGSTTPAFLCAWFVLGEELTIREWAIREGWNQRPLSEHGAKGILQGTLSALAGHYGL